MIRLVLVGLAAMAALLTVIPGADAGSSGYRSGAKVKGHVERRGGYSYTYADSVNTYGDSRSIYGGASAYRDPSLDKQTSAGPFDHGFFFDSGVTGPHGGDSPYMN